MRHGPYGIFRSEREPGDQRARAARKYGHTGIGLYAARCGVSVDDAKPGRIDPCSLGHVVLGVRRGWIWQQGPIKDVDELGANLEAHPFLDPEGATEVRVLRRTAWTAEIRVKHRWSSRGGSCRGARCVGGAGRPRERIQHLYGSRIVAVDIVDVHVVQRLAGNPYVLAGQEIRGGAGWRRQELPALVDRETSDLENTL